MVDAWPDADWDVFMRRMKASDLLAGLDIQRRTSAQGAYFFADGSLDFVFIHGPRASQSVEQDLTTWWPKVRSGGLLAGYHPGGGPAIDAFVESLGPASAQQDRNESFWMIRKSGA